MKGDTNPSFVCALFGIPRVNKALIKDIDGKNGMRIREVKLIDISMPMDKRYDENINYLKHFTMPILKRFIDVKFPFRDMILKILHKQVKLKILNYKKDWKTDTRHKFLFSGFTPVAFDTKYYNFCTSETERKNFKKAETFTSENYKPIINNVPTDPKLIINDKDLK